MTWYWYEIVEQGLVYAKDEQEARVMCLTNDDLQHVATQILLVEEYRIDEEEKEV